MTDEVRSAAAAFVGAAPVVAAIASVNHRVYRVTGAGRTVIVKCAGDGPRAAEFLRREQAVLRLLSAEGMAVPQVLAAGDAYTVMSALAGESLEGSGDAAAWRDAGRFVGRLAAVRSLGMPPAVASRGVVELLVECRGILRRAKRLDRALEAVLVEAITAHERGPVHVVHGDYGANQVLWDGVRAGVVDWESGGMGRPLMMLGRLTALTREYGREQQAIGWVVEGFASAWTFGPHERRELAVWDVVSDLCDAAWKLSAGGGHVADADRLIDGCRRRCG